MTIRSPNRRLRLIILSLSLFCSGIAAGQLTGTPGLTGTVPQNPPKVSGSADASQLDSRPQLPPGVTIRNVKIETIISVSSEGSVAGAPGSNPNRLPLPVDGSAVKIERRELYGYSMELRNDGPKAIKALAWDFTFVDPTTNVEQVRHSFANLQKIDSRQMKKVRFTTQLGPPRVVEVTALGKDPKESFREYAVIQCVLFTDGSTWELPNTNGKPCDRLSRWLERRKTWRPSLEDLPFNP